MLSYDQTGEMIFSYFHSISFDELDEYYYETKRDLSNFNHIHILFAFDNNYYLLSSISITSILKTANENSYIHFHIIATRGFKFETILKKKIIQNLFFIMALKLK
jgi:hypothetical protein